MVNKIKWYKLIERKAETLIVYQIVAGRRYYDEMLGIKFKPQNIKHENWWYYLDVKEMKQEYVVLKQAYEKEPNFFEKLSKKIHKQGKELVKLTDQITKKVKTADKNKLRVAFERYNIALEKFASTTWVTFTIEKILSDEIKKRLEKIYPNLNEEDYNNYFFILTTFQKKSASRTEYETLLKIAAEYNKHGLTFEINRKIKETYNKFYWLGAVKVGWTYLAEPYNLKYYIDFVKELSKGNPFEELKEINKKTANSKKDYKAFVGRSELDKNLINSGKILQEYIFLRTARGEYIVRAMISAKKLLTEIAKRLNLRLDDVVYFTPKEISRVLETDKLPDFKSRKSDYTLTVIGNKISLK